MEFKDVLKELRKEKGLSQYKLAQKTNLSLSTIQKYEMGYNKPTQENLYKLAFVLEVNPKELAQIAYKHDLPSRSERLFNLDYSYFVTPEIVLESANKLLTFINRQYINKGFNEDEIEIIDPLRTKLTIVLDDLFQNLSEFIHAYNENEMNELKKAININLDELYNTIHTIHERIIKNRHQ